MIVEDALPRHRPAIGPPCRRKRGLSVHRSFWHTTVHRHRARSMVLSLHDLSYYGSPSAVSVQLRTPRARRHRHCGRRRLRTRRRQRRRCEPGAHTMPIASTISNPPHRRDNRDNNRLLPLGRCTPDVLGPRTLRPFAKVEFHAVAPPSDSQGLRHTRRSGEQKLIPRFPRIVLDEPESFSTRNVRIDPVIAPCLSAPYRRSESPIAPMEDHRHHPVRLTDRLCHSAHRQALAIHELYEVRVVVPRKGRILRTYRFPEHCRTSPGNSPTLSNSPHQSFPVVHSRFGVFPSRVREIARWPTVFVGGQRLY